MQEFWDILWGHPQDRANLGPLKTLLLPDPPMSCSHYAEAEGWDRVHILR